MRTLKTLASLMLMSTVAATPFTLTSCQDDLSTEELKANANVPSLLNTADLQALNTYSYEVPFEVKAKGEWRIDFEWEDGEQICYASPKQGKGDTKINICVLDNATDKHRTGEMIITDFGDNGKKTVVKLGQKSQLEDTRADKISTGNCIYGVGYGYNAMSGKLAANQIVKMADAIKDNILVTEGVRASYALREYKGSCFSQLCNNFKADASFSGKYFGFKGEAGASFDSKYLRESNRDYVISMVDVTTTQATLGYNRDQIIDAMTDAAYNAINGLAMKSTKGRPMKTSYPSTNEGFKKLIQDYGTHMLVRAELGGKMKYATTIDLSKVESEYTLNTFAKCSYNNKFIKAKAGVSDDLSSQFSNNRGAIDTKLTILGGSPTCLESLSKEDNDANMDAWVKSLQDNQNTVVVNLPKAERIPLWELVNTAEPGGDKRKEMLKEYMKEGGQMERDFTISDKGITQEMGQIAHITGLGDMKNPVGRTLIRDLYIGGTVVARVCSEFIPKFSLTERSVVVYPVYNNRVRYNMGYFIGNSAWAPQYICWKNEGDPIISKVDGMKPGTQNELYLSGSSFYTAGDPAIKEATEQKTDVKVQPAYMQGPTWWRSDDKEHVHNYPIVKIFNRIWTVVTHNQLIDGRTCYYRASDLKKFTVEKWRVASVEDYENLKNGLTSNNISLPVQYMSDVEGGKDLTGFGIDWDTWEMRIDYAAQLDETLKKIEEKPFFFGIGKFITSLTVNAANNVAKEKMKMDGNQYKWVTVNSDKLMEYLATTKDGKFGHVRFNKNGSMEIITKDFDKDAFEMQVRMVQPLNPEMPKQAKK